MLQEDKELLLKDLSARLLYGVKAQVRINVKYSDAHKPNSETCIGDIWGITTNKPYTAWVYSFITIYPCASEQNMCSISDCKPYLRPLSSMTEEERKYIEDKCAFTTMGPIGDNFGLVMPVIATEWLTDFYNSHHLDWRGLIEKELALEAPKDMYNIQEKHKI